MSVINLILPQLVQAARKRGLKAEAVSKKGSEMLSFGIRNRMKSRKHLQTRLFVCSGCAVAGDEVRMFQVPRCSNVTAALVLCTRMAWQPRVSPVPHRPRSSIRGIVFDSLEVSVNDLARLSTFGSAEN